MKSKFAIFLLVFSLGGSFTLGQEKPAKPPRMEEVTELKAIHRQGQTFLTWKEADSPAKDDTLSMAKYCLTIVCVVATNAAAEEKLPALDSTAAAEGTEVRRRSEEGTFETNTGRHEPT